MISSFLFLFFVGQTPRHECTVYQKALVRAWEGGVGGRANLNNSAHAALMSPKHLEASKEQQHFADRRSVCPPLIRSPIQFACYKRGRQKLLGGREKKWQPQNIVQLASAVLKAIFLLDCIAGGLVSLFVFLFASPLRLLLTWHNIWFRLIRLQQHCLGCDSITR